MLYCDVEYYTHRNDAKARASVKPGYSQIDVLTAGQPQAMLPGDTHPTTVVTKETGMGWKAVKGGIETSGPLAKVMVQIESYYEQDIGTRYPEFTLDGYCVAFARVLQTEQCAKWEAGGLLDRRRALKLAAMVHSETEHAVVYPLMRVLDYIAEHGDVTRSTLMATRKRTATWILGRIERHGSSDAPDESSEQAPTGQVSFVAVHNHAELDADEMGQWEGFALRIGDSSELWYAIPDAVPQARCLAKLTRDLGPDIGDLLVPGLKPDILRAGDMWSIRHPESGRHLLDLPTHICDFLDELERRGAEAQAFVMLRLVKLPDRTPNEVRLLFMPAGLLALPS
jgi:hypothetical protein